MNHSIVAIGDSHLEPIMGAYLDLGGADAIGYEIHPIRLTDKHYDYAARHATDVSIYSQLARDEIEALITSTAPVAVLSVISGNTHLVYGAINSPTKFDFILPAEPGLALTPAAQVVPYDLVTERLMADRSPLLSLIGLIRSNHNVDIYQVAAPPPVANNDTVAAHIPADWRTQMEELGISPPHFRYKVWRAVTNVSQILSTKFGAHFLNVPAVALDAEGFLLEEYRADALHGNLSYGKLVIAQLLDLLRVPANTGEA